MHTEREKESNILNTMCELGELACALSDKTAVQLNALAIVACATDVNSIEDVESALEVCRLSMEQAQELLGGIRALHLAFIKHFLYQEGVASSPDWASDVTMQKRTMQGSARAPGGSGDPPGAAAA